VARRWIIAAAVCGVLVLAGVWARRPRGDDLEAIALAAQARAEARAAGFKVELAEFDFALDEAARRRLTAVTNAGALLNRELWLSQMQWMQSVAPGAAVSGWRGEGPWAAAEIAFRSRAAAHDAAVAAVLEPGPLRTEPIVRDCSILLPHLAPLGQLAHALTMRMTLDLRAGRLAEAWTNLLAVNTLAARYEPEPFLIPLSVGDRLAQRAFTATWEALRTNVWSEAQLAQLAALWETPKLWQIAENTSSTRTAEVLCWIKLAREEARTNRLSWAEVTPPWSTLLSHPMTFGRETWKRLRTHRQNRLWARRNSYLDEVILISFQRDRREDLRRAAAQPTWAAMQAIPGATQAVQLTLTTNYPSKVQAMINLRAMSFAFAVWDAGPDPSFIKKLVRHEMRRRVLLAALAVERFRARHGRLPASLDELPGALPDFADGEPLRYRPAPDGTFVLYSVGLDLRDDGGRMRDSTRGYPASLERDVVWPREASAEQEAAWRERRAARWRWNPAGQHWFEVPPPPELMETEPEPEPRR
jgi:hypothetical protein